MKENPKKPKEKSEDKVEKLTNDLKRKQADLENFAKRIEKEQKEFIKFSNSKIIIEFLPILDELEIAVKNMKDENDKKGVQMILDRMKKTLKEQGVKQINTKDQKFDPFKHEIVCSEESNKEKNTILEETQKGYTLHDKIIRFAKVKIAKKEKEKKNDE